MRSFFRTMMYTRWYWRSQLYNMWQGSFWERRRCLQRTTEGHRVPKIWRMTWQWPKFPQPRTLGLRWFSDRFVLCSFIIHRHPTCRTTRPSVRSIDSEALELELELELGRLIFYRNIHCSIVPWKTLAPSQTLPWTAFLSCSTSAIAFTWRRRAGTVDWEFMTPKNHNWNACSRWIVDLSFHWRHPQPTNISFTRVDLTAPSEPLMYKHRTQK